jgi:hypothetical protein
LNKKRKAFFLKKSKIFLDADDEGDEKNTKIKEAFVCICLKYKKHYIFFYDNIYFHYGYLIK